MVLLRLLAINAWCAMVNVTPEESNKAVLMVGSQKGVMLENGSMRPAGAAVAPALTEGQIASKPGHRSAFSTLPRAGTETVRIHQKTAKKQPKNNTTKKINKQKR